ncbi:hypothetical protein EJ05DRAFT_536932 [Pseudovirgaria hyperparasitica]|uniref:Uncharacterized protein n=1 Tax=Pseudovirgaria hyperparasitica TaxID=470096 RepID=A0A6A6WCU1_9PEZI|nr:uncharacterized protein EJ05DRAFT_536932 [Pseudovirgaria hyperparasitica]KAF2759666.1 hypothetical protein EJ05DRAFT_536932 [Pseudovirgaria hyperparasitica]
MSPWDTFPSGERRFKEGQAASHESRALSGREETQASDSKPRFLSRKPSIEPPPGVTARLKKKLQPYRDKDTQSNPWLRESDKAHEPPQSPRVTELSEESANMPMYNELHPPPISKSYGSYWDRKERTHERKNVPVASFMVKPGCIFHTPEKIPRDSIANKQVDDGWWAHPILILSYDKRTEIASVLLITTLAGKKMSECYRPGVSMRRRLLYILNSGQDAQQENSEGMPTLSTEKESNNMYLQSYVKINAPVCVERRYILHLSMSRTVKLDALSIATVNLVLGNWLATAEAGALPSSSSAPSTEAQDEADDGNEVYEYASAQRVSRSCSPVDRMSSRLSHMGLCATPWPETPARRGRGAGAAGLAASGLALRREGRGQEFGINFARAPMGTIGRGKGAGGKVVGEGKGVVGEAGKENGEGV